jgi:hypothetical protein
MDMRTSWAVAAVAALVLAGCAGNDVEEAEPRHTEASRPAEHAVAAHGHGLAFHDCTEVGGAFPVPAELLRPRMPHGFAPVTVDDAGLVGTILAFAYECAEGRAGGHGLQRVAEMWAVVPVVPPDSERREEATSYSFVLGAFVSSPEAAKVYAHWGLNGSVFHGHVEIGLLSDEAGRLGRAIGADADFRVELDAAAGGLVAGADGGRGRMFFADGDLELLGALDFAYSPYRHMSTAGAAAFVASVPLGPLPPLVPQDGAAGAGFHDWGWSSEAWFTLPGPAHEGQGGGAVGWRLRGMSP